MGCLLLRARFWAVWGMWLLITAAEGRFLRSESWIDAYVRQRGLLYGFVAQFCSYTAVE